MSPYASTRRESPRSAAPSAKESVVLDAICMLADHLVDPVDIVSLARCNHATLECLIPGMWRRINRFHHLEEVGAQLQRIAGRIRRDGSPMSEKEAAEGKRRIKIYLASIQSLTLEVPVRHIGAETITLQRMLRHGAEVHTSGSVGNAMARVEALSLILLEKLDHETTDELWRWFQKPLKILRLTLGRTALPTLHYVWCGVVGMCATLQELHVLVEGYEDWGGVEWVTAGDALGCFDRLTHLSLKGFVEGVPELLPRSMKRMPRLLHLRIESISEAHQLLHLRCLSSLEQLQLEVLDMNKGMLGEVLELLASLSALSTLELVDITGRHEGPSLQLETPLWPVLDEHSSRYSTFPDFHVPCCTFEGRFKDVTVLIQHVTGLEELSIKMPAYMPMEESSRAIARYVVVHHSKSLRKLDLTLGTPATWAEDSPRDFLGLGMEELLQLRHLSAFRLLLTWSSRRSRSFMISIDDMWAMSTAWPVLERLVCGTDAPHALTLPADPGLGAPSILSLKDVLVLLPNWPTLRHLGVDCLSIEDFWNIPIWCNQLISLDIICAYLDRMAPLLGLHRSLRRLKGPQGETFTKVRIHRLMGAPGQPEPSFERMQNDWAQLAYLVKAYREDGSISVSPLESATLPA